VVALHFIAQLLQVLQLQPKHDLVRLRSNATRTRKAAWPLTWLPATAAAATMPEAVSPFITFHLQYTTISDN
jgi:hypothetical protein